MGFEVGAIDKVFNKGFMRHAIVDRIFKDASRPILLKKYQEELEKTTTAYIGSGVSRAVLEMTLTKKYIIINYIKPGTYPGLSYSINLENMKVYSGDIRL